MGLQLRHAVERSQTTLPVSEHSSCLFLMLPAACQAGMFNVIYISCGKKSKFAFLLLHVYLRAAYSLMGKGEIPSKKVMKT